MADLTFFSDPAVDRVLGVVMELAEEVYTLRQKVRTLEGASDEGGTQGRDAFVARILVPLTYERESPAPEFEAP
jgi:hypothetical protein